ncbi:MAG: L,D-transpeptidase family protein [Peptoniphilus sp.]|nr:L,D-transpeptidase family protein [Peptoniphilus sp.]MDD7363601.1 L,D-transpeptidase family protein [Bacillota bacterium]MDY6045208.1 L,D-transpeptidase family protein [Peptoniphilus sp.]
MTKKMTKIIVVILGILALLYVLGSLVFSQVYMPNTSVNGADISLQSRAELPKLFKQSWSNYYLKLNGRGDKTDVIRATDIDYVETMPSFDGERENPWAWPILAFVPKDYKVDTSIEYDDEKFEKELAELHIVSDSDIVDPQPERIAYENGKGYYIAPAESGTRINGPKLKRAVLKAFHSQDRSMDADAAKLYIEPKPAESPDKMKNHVASLNAIESYALTYNFSDREEALSGQSLIDLHSADETGALVPDEEKVKGYVEALAEKYDTFHGTRDFKATGGAMMRIEGGIYGWQIDQAKTSEQLMTALKAQQSEEMEPIYKRKARSRNVDDIGDSYIEIDLARQHMWLYSHGNLVVQTDIVSGNPYAGNGTPTGVQEIWMKERNRTLKGATWSSYVRYWMPFDWTGCGIHDSSWRGSYGGSIYLGGGSHGCVNTPSSKAPIFYENAFEGMPVIVYNSSKHAI